MSPTLRKYLSLFALGLAGGASYFLPYIKYSFYDAQIAAMGITHAQSGLLLTVYTIGNIILYIPGGILADKLHPRWTIVISCAVTGLLSFLYAMTMSYTLGIIIWLLLSFSTAFVFWSALMKAIRMVGEEKEQGLMYGFYYACNGLSGAATAAIALAVFNSRGNDIDGFKAAVNAGGVIVIVAAVLVAILLRDGKLTASAEEDKFHFSDLGYILRKPVIWIISIVIFCGYGVYSCSSYFTPYLSEVCGLNTSETALVAVFRSYGFLLLAPVGGLIADKLFKNTAKWLAFILTVIGILFLGMLLFGQSANASFSIFYSLLIGALCMMMYGTIFSMMSGAGIARKFTGTAIGIASIVGYLPDSFYSAMFGTWLDRYGGATGYPMIFSFLGVTAILGAILAVVVLKLNKRSGEKLEEV